jgi:hypothetical protein
LVVILAEILAHCKHEIGSVIRRAGPAMHLAVEEARRFGEEHKAG